MARKNMPAGPGRPPGLPNRATQEAREAIGRFVDDNAGRLQAWLDAIAIENPQKAFELFQSVIEYHVPKLARTVHAGDSEAPLVNNPSADALIAFLLAKGATEYEIRQFISDSEKTEEKPL